MKARRILAVVALMLCFATVLVSCNKSTHASIDDIFNPDYEAPVSTLTSYKAMDDLGELYDYNDAFVIFADENEEDETIVYSVYSNYTNTVIKTYTEEEGNAYSFTFAYDCDAILLVATATWDINADPMADEAEISLSLIDAKGNAFATFDEDEIDIAYLFEYGTDGLISSFTEDLLNIDGDLYRAGKDGVVTLVKEFVFTDLPEISFEGKDYYYVDGDEIIYIYDKSFKLLSSYTMPSYAEGSYYLLNDGNLFVQYMVELPDDATEYDFRDGTTKYALFTKIVSAKTGEAKDVKDVNYVVNGIYSKTMLTYMTEESQFAEKFENLAHIGYIDEATKMIDESYFAFEYVYLSNSGKVEQSLKLSETAIGMPYYIAKGIYAVSLIDGSMMLVDADGKELAMVNDLSMVAGKYMEIDNAIYAIDGTKVYDLKEKKAEIYSYYDLSALIIAEETVNDEEISVLYLFINGEMKKVAELGDGVEFDETWGYYSIYNADTDKTAFYNQKGDLIQELDGSFTYSFSCYDGMFVQDEEGNYHKFIFDVIPDRNIF